METIFVLLPLALLIAGIALALFIWAARSGQFDDLETPAVRILFDDEEPRATREKDVPAKPSETTGETGTPPAPEETTEAPPTRRDPK